MIIDLATQFSPYPSGRYPSDGAHSGQLFRDDFVVPALRAAVESGSVVIIDIDGVRTFGSSFLEESFGGLIRLGLFSHDDVAKHLVIQCSKPHLEVFKDAITSVIHKAKIEAPRVNA